MNILVTGESGYLCRSIINEFVDDNIIKYKGDIRHIKMFSDIDMIIHFASPSERSEFKDARKTTTTIIDGTVNMVKIANTNNAKLVFASTMGIYTFDIDDVYCSCKRAMEHYIIANCNNYLITRIPRVYSSCRNKGLIKSLKNNTVKETDLDKQLNYLDLKDFKKQFLCALHHENTIHEYTEIKTNTIREIKNLYAK